MIVIATVYEYDYKATVVYIRHMNIITSVWLLLPCLWPFNFVHVLKELERSDLVKKGGVKRKRG